MLRPKQNCEVAGTGVKDGENFKHSGLLSCSFRPQNEPPLLIINIIHSDRAPPPTPQLHNRMSGNEQPPLQSHEHPPPLRPPGSQVGVQYDRPLFRVCGKAHTVNTAEKS